MAGHINPQASRRPVLTVSLERMNRLLDLDRESLVATFGPGAAGPQVESQLRALGHTLGHFAVLGVVDPRWLGRQPLQWPAVAALRADRTTFRRRDPGDLRRAA
ncbi:FAD-binding protein [Pseudomonas aeruginosa]|nr:FAD-binding protein [Pseudomonas aeruginosa]